MKKYNVSGYQKFDIVVEAENEKDAIKKADKESFDQWEMDYEYCVWIDPKTVVEVE